METNVDCGAMWTAWKKKLTSLLNDRSVIKNLILKL